MREVRVQTPNGKWVHAANVTTASGRRYTVLCNRVPRWHKFTETEDKVTCPHCLGRMKNLKRR